MKLFTWALDELHKAKRLEAKTASRFARDFYVAPFYGLAVLVVTIEAVLLALTLTFNYHDINVLPHFYAVCGGVSLSLAAYCGLIVLFTKEPIERKKVIALSMTVTAISVVWFTVFSM